MRTRASAGVEATRMPGRSSDFYRRRGGRIPPGPPCTGLRSKCRSWSSRRRRPHMSISRRVGGQEIENDDKPLRPSIHTSPGSNAPSYSPVTQSKARTKLNDGCRILSLCQSLCLIVSFERPPMVRRRPSLSFHGGGAGALGGVRSIPSAPPRPRSFRTYGRISTRREVSQCRGLVSRTAGRPKAAIRQRSTPRSTRSQQPHIASSARLVTLPCRVEANGLKAGALPASSAGRARLARGAAVFRSQGTAPPTPILRPSARPEIAGHPSCASSFVRVSGGRGGRR